MKKKIFAANFFCCSFKISTSILTKLRLFSAFSRHFYGAMRSLWLLMSLRKFWKNNWKFSRNGKILIFLIKNFKFISCLIWIEELDNDWIIRPHAWFWIRLANQCFHTSGPDFIDFLISEKYRFFYVFFKNRNYWSYSTAFATFLKENIS